MTDSSGNPKRHNYFPIACKTNAHSFDIIVKKKNDYYDYQRQAVGAPLNEAANHGTETAIASLQIGDRIAIKLEKFCEISNIEGAFSHTSGIDGIVMVASGYGIIPAYTLLKNLLSESLTNVANVELLWLNSQKDDFILQNEVEELERNFPSVVSVTRVIDHDLLKTDKKLSNQVAIATMPFRLGRIAFMFTPVTLHSKITAFLTTAGYSKNSIMSMTT